MAKYPAQQIIRPFEKALTVVQTDDSRPRKRFMDTLVGAKARNGLGQSDFAGLDFTT